MPQHERQDYLALVEKKRGKAARATLDDSILDVRTRGR